MSLPSNFVPKEVRTRIYMRDNFTCVYCKTKIQDWRDLSLDHVTPRSQGGKNHSTNLVCSCRDCNRDKGDTPLEQFVTKWVVKRVRKQTRKPLPPLSAPKNLTHVDRIIYVMSIA